MNGAGMLAWREHMRIKTKREAAQLLGIAENTISKYEANPEEPVPRTVALACRAIANGLTPWGE